jgi:hypothetical protein
MTKEEFIKKYQPLRRQSNDEDTIENDFILNYGLSKLREDEWETIRACSYDNTWSIVVSPDEWAMLPGFRYECPYYVISRIPIEDEDREFPIQETGRVYPIQDKIVLLNCINLIQRSNVGISKYGTTLKDNTKDDFMQHLLEELLDAVNYLTKLKEDNVSITKE